MRSAGAEWKSELSIENYAGRDKHRSEVREVE